jgi:hypothetical protein
MVGWIVDLANCGDCWILGFCILTKNLDLMPIVYHGLVTPMVLIGLIVTVVIGLLPGVMIGWIAEYFRPIQVELF